MLLFFDTESTGLPGKDPVGHPNYPRLAQLAAIMVDPVSQDEVMRLDVVLYRDHIPASASAIHGITTEFAKNYGVNEGSALQIFDDMVAVSDVIVAHNVQFDVKIVTSAMRVVFDDKTLDPFAGKNLFCTMRAATPVCKMPSRQGGFKPPKLIEAHQFFTGEGFDKAHQAINDVLACRRVYFKLMEHIAQ